MWRNVKKEEGPECDPFRRAWNNRRSAVLLDISSQRQLIFWGRSHPREFNTPPWESCTSTVQQLLDMSPAACVYLLQYKWYLQLVGTIYTEPCIHAAVVFTVDPVAPGVRTPNEASLSCVIVGCTRCTCTHLLPRTKKKRPYLSVSRGEEGK